MDSIAIHSICESRMLVGFLGEKHQASWWESSFLSSSSKAFLTPTYPNSSILAQYRGVCQAASLIHDEHIGMGKHYNLYRLPDSIERMLSSYLQDDESAKTVTKYISTREIVLDRLRALGAQNIEPSDGPVIVGDFSDTDLDKLLSISLSHYKAAFDSGCKTFPYMRCS